MKTLLLLLGGLALGYCAAIYLPIFKTGLTTEERSFIATTISGTAGTLIAMLGFFAVVVTLHLQYSESVRDNEATRVARESQRLEIMFGTLREDINSLELLTRDDAKRPLRLYGRDALELFADSFSSSEDHGNIIRSGFFQDIYFICGSFETMIDRIMDANLPEEERKYFMTRLCYLYSSRLTKPLTILEAMSEKGQLKLKVDKT
jgi:hypothetical protein